MNFRRAAPSKTATDSEVQLIADEIYSLLRRFKNPQDASAALILSQYKFMMASFSRDYIEKADLYIDSCAEDLKRLFFAGKAKEAAGQ